MPSPWSLSKHQAVLTLDSIRAEINLDRLQSGLVIKDGHGPLPSIPTWLGLLIEDGRIASPPLVDCYIRGQDLVANCDTLRQWPIRLELHWHVSPRTAATPAYLDLQISVNTGLLVGAPQLGVITQGTFSEVVIPPAIVQSAASTDWRRLSTESGFSAVELGGGPVVCRLPGSSLSYLEMVHPTDYCAATIEGATSSAVTLQNVLFRERLEKGVIRRARIRAMFVSRETDVDAARQLYQQFAAEDADLSA